MRRALGLTLGSIGGLLALLLTGVSDMGQITVPTLALGLMGATGLIGLSYALMKPFKTTRGRVQCKNGLKWIFHPFSGLF